MTEGSAPSGRFVLRLPPSLHETLRAAAGQAGLSLNEYCVRTLSTPGPDPTGPGAAVVVRALEMFGPQLVGVIVYGSWARGEATAASDIDLLVVLETSARITRMLYRDWDRVPLRHDGRAVEVHFVGLPTPADEPGAVFLEAAMDGLVVYDSGQRVARYLARLRRVVASGDVARRRAHGQPYWTTAS